MPFEGRWRNERLFRLCDTFILFTMDNTKALTRKHANLPVSIAANSGQKTVWTSPSSQSRTNIAAAFYCSRQVSVSQGLHSKHFIVPHETKMFHVKEQTENDIANNSKFSRAIWKWNVNIDLAYRRCRWHFRGRCRILHHACARIRRAVARHTPSM